MLLIVTEDGGLLLHHRDDKPGIPNPDCWAGFGGAVEDGTIASMPARAKTESTAPGPRMKAKAPSPSTVACRSPA